MEVMQTASNYFIRLGNKTENFNDVLASVKSIPGRTYDSNTLAWKIPASKFPSLDALLEKIQSDVQLAKIKKEATKAEVVALPELTIEVPLKKEMFPFQKKGVAYGIDRGSCLNGDQQGLGKTVEAIATVIALNAFPCLIVAKKSLCLNWEAEIKEWSDKKAIFFKDSVKHSWQHFFTTGLADIGIVNYESLQKYFVNRINVPEGEQFRVKHIEFKESVNIFKSIIVDESHYVKDGSTIRTKICIGLAFGKPHVFCLSGTPVLNDPKELYPQLCILNKAHLFGTKAQFEKMYSGRKNRGNLKQLNYLLHKHCYFRRTKAEVLTDLPAKTRQVVLCEITNRNEYLKAENDFKKFLEDQLNLTAGQIDNKMRAEALVKMMELKKLAARGKMESVIEWMKDLAEQGEKMVMFGYHKEITEQLANVIPGSVRLCASAKQEELQARKIAFQTDPKVPACICSISADAEGHTLTAASYLGMVEFPWHFGKAEQCEDRIHRIGQQDGAGMYYFIAVGTIDKKIYDLIMDKKDMHDKLTGTEDEVEEKVIDKLISLFNQK